MIRHLQKGNHFSISMFNSLTWELLTVFMTDVVYDVIIGTIPSWYQVNRASIVLLGQRSIVPNSDVRHSLCICLPNPSLTCTYQLFRGSWTIPVSLTYPISVFHIQYCVYFSISIDWRISDRCVESNKSWVLIAQY